MHEGMHARGVWTEWLAECLAIEPTIRFLKKWGVPQYEREAARDWLLYEAEESRPAEYKLRGRC